MKKIHILTTAVLAMTVLAIAPAQAATRYITVNASGTVKVAPDAVRINGTVNVVAGNSKQALADASSAMSKVRTALTSSGIASKDLSTQSLTVYPEYNYTQDKGSYIVGYRAQQSFIAIVRAAKNAGAVVDAAVAAGGDALQVSGVTPFIIDDAAATASARSEAVKNAKAKATSYAKLLGVKLKGVNFLTENSSPSYVPMLAMAKAADGATEVDLGQQDVTVSITVQWAL